MFKIFKETKDVFVKPKKVYYLGRLKYGTPYFYPMYFNKTIITIKRLKRRTDEKYKDYVIRFPHLYKSNKSKYSNLPMVRRSTYWVVEIFNRSYYIEIGYPIRIHITQLGWKTKWGSVRFEWCPQFSIFFFNWQFCIWWVAPDKNNDLYYEMMLHYLHKSNKDINKAKETWGWIDCETKESTWNDKYLKN